MLPPDEYDLDEFKDVCAMCNHNRIYHIYIREMAMLVCKVKGCKCLRNVPDMMSYKTKLLEELR